jgi:hypothetical protein
MNFSEQVDKLGQFEDYFFFYVHPAVMLFATILNVICSIVLAQKELRTSSAFFQYSLVNSVNSALGSFLAAFLFIVECGQLCTLWSGSYVGQMYKLIAVAFLVSTLYFFTSLIQLIISLHLYFKMKQQLNIISKGFSFTLTLSMLIISISYGALFASRFRVLRVLHEDAHGYSYEMHLKDELHKNSINFILVLILTLLNQIIFVVLVLINWLILIEIRRIIKKKHTICVEVNLIKRVLVTNSKETSSSSDLFKYTTSKEFANQQLKYNGINDDSSNDRKVKKKILIVFLWVSFVFCSSRLVHGISNMISLFQPFSFASKLWETVNFMWAGLVYSSYFFVYFCTNKLFKKTFCRLFLRKKVD